MKNKSCLLGLLDVKAFTLIELLVVVLIIGILAAVAVPQYQKTVWKSRNSQLKQLVKIVAQAEQAYYMANGRYAANFDELAIDLPLTPVATTKGGYTGACGVTTQGIDASRSGKDFYIILNSTDANMSSVNVVAYWKQGQYKCAGFGVCLGRVDYPQLETLHCREKRWGGVYTAGDGAFCNQLEKAVYDSSDTSWRHYLY